MPNPPYALTPADVLYEDEHVLAVSKPAGLSTQAPPIAGMTLERAVRAYLCPEAPRASFVGTVHRLDRPVSGVVLWAKTRRAARLVAGQFERRAVAKEYWALVEGGPPEEGAEATWHDWLVREDTGLGRVQVAAAGTPRAQEARTRVRREPAPASAAAGLAWLRLWPETGRMHQLRVQASARGWPIAGDRLYGSPRDFDPPAIALHARSLTLAHPRDGRVLELVAPLPGGAWAAAGLTVAPPAVSPR